MIALIGRVAFTLTFEAPDIETFPALRIAREVLAEGGSAPIVMNAANEIAVAQFLENKIGFLNISAVVENSLSKFKHRRPRTLSDVHSIDTEARRVTATVIDTMLRKTF